MDANEKAGRPSSEWGMADESGQVFIPAIHPAEWLMDPEAAR